MFVPVTCHNASFSFSHGDVHELLFKYLAHKLLQPTQYSDGSITTAEALETSVAPQGS